MSFLWGEASYGLGGCSIKPDHHHDSPIPALVQSIKFHLPTPASPVTQSSFHGLVSHYSIHCHSTLILLKGGCAVSGISLPLLWGCETCSSVPGWLPLLCLSCCAGARSSCLGPGSGAPQPSPSSPLWHTPVRCCRESAGGKGARERALGAARL